MSLEGPCSALATVGIVLSDHHLKEEQSEVKLSSVPHPTNSDEDDDDSNSDVDNSIDGKELAKSCNRNGNSLEVDAKSDTTGALPIQIEKNGKKKLVGPKRKRKTKTTKQCDKNGIDGASSESEGEDADKKSAKRLKKTKKVVRKKKSEKGKSKKPTTMRKNIKQILTEQDLTDTTKEARAEEAERLRRLMIGQQVPQPDVTFNQSLPPFADFQDCVNFSELQSQPQLPEIPSLSPLAFIPKVKEEEIITLSSDEEVLPDKPIITPTRKVDNDSDCQIISEEEEEDELEDPEGLGLHVNDLFNVPEPDGRILVNKRHPASDPDVFLAPQFQGVIKPHQVGGLRFLYDNIIESTSRYDHSNGFGCILAHSMGLGKTLQLVAFSDIFLRHTSGRRVLCIVPINTLQNWLAEYNRWIPQSEDLVECPEKQHYRPRNFKIHLLNDSLKTLEQRAVVIMNWKSQGGVLLIGYELYRLLATKTQRKKRKSKKNACPQFVDFEEEDKEKTIFEDVYKALVNPGPDLVICDEGHRIKNSHASTSQALKDIKTKRRVVLTGYPLQNNLMEYWCMVDFVRPNFLGNKAEFSNMFERPIQNGQCIDSTPKDTRLMMHRVHVLQQQLQGFVQRRGHQVLRASLPPKREYVLLFRMTPYQRKLYKLFMEELISHRSVSNPLRAFAICCKIWNHPDILFNYVRAHEESVDLDLEWDEVNGTSKPSSAKLKGKGKKKKNAQQQQLQLQQLQQQQQQQLQMQQQMKYSDQLFYNPYHQQQPSTSGQNLNFFPNSVTNSDDSNSMGEGLVNLGPGFAPFQSPSKKDEVNLEWTNGVFDNYVEGQLENSHKLLVFVEILDDTVRTGDRLLFFSQSLLTLNLVEEFLKKRVVPGCPSGEPWCPGVSYFRLDGSTPALERERLINNFNSNDKVKLFLVSTRAGSLGINLVGANRVVVFDASWNPCHDSQAVCRVYRYGQTKISHIYRFVTDNSLEKKIFDRQVNKQGMADRVVDESNPEARMYSKDIQCLICDNERDPPPNEWDVNSALEKIQEADPVLANIVYNRSDCFSTAPFTHESLLVDHKEKKLSKAEKKMALRNFEYERSAKSGYTRASYAAFYPKPEVAEPVAGIPNLYQTAFSNNPFFNRQLINPAQSPSTSTWAQNVFNGPPTNPSTSMALRKALEAKQIQRTQDYGYQFQGLGQGVSASSGGGYNMMPDLNYQGPSYHSLPPVQQPLPQYLHSKAPNNPRLPYQETAKLSMEAFLKRDDVLSEEFIFERDMTFPGNGQSDTVFARKGDKGLRIRTPKGVYVGVGGKFVKLKSTSTPEQPRPPMTVTEPEVISLDSD